MKLALIQVIFWDLMHRICESYKTQKQGLVLGTMTIMMAIELALEKTIGKIVLTICVLLREKIH